MAENEEVLVTIKYMVNLAEKAGKKEESVRFPSGCTLRTVADWLKKNRDISLPSPSIMATLNGKGWNQYPDKEETVLDGGATILLFPPISGG